MTIYDNCDNMTDVLHWLGIAENAALEAGEAVMRIYRSGKLDIGVKPDASPITRADRSAQDIIFRHLGGTGLPVLSEEADSADHRRRMKWDYFWMVDPLDGTKEFIGGRDEFTVNIALMRGMVPTGGVIHAPARDVLYTGSKAGGVWKKQGGKVLKSPPLAIRPSIQDLRQKERVTVVVSRSHLSGETMDFIRQFPDVSLISMGSSLKFMALVEGTADIYPRLGVTMEWDTAAAHAILHASNRGVYEINMSTELRYNKPDLRNPFFIAF